MATIHMRGGRKLGAHFDASFASCYMAFRRPKDIFRNDDSRAKRRSITQAIEDGDAMWSMDIETLMDLKRKSITHLFIRMRPQNIVFFTLLEVYFTKGMYKRADYTSTGGVDQRFVPLKYFQVIDFSHKI